MAAEQTEVVLRLSQVARRYGNQIALDQVETRIHRSCRLAERGRHGGQFLAGYTSVEEALRPPLGFASVPWSFASQGLGLGALVDAL